jgi:hypothetical protein
MKAQMDTTAVLIIAVVTLGIGILLFIKFGFLTHIFEIITIPLNSIMSMLRGILVKGLWSLIGPLVGVAALMIWTSPKFWNPAGAIAGTSLTVGTAIVITTVVLSIFSVVPLLHVPTDTIHIGKTEGGEVHSVPESEIMKSVADGIVGCFQMYGSNQYDPLTGLDPPNPAACFSMEIAPKETMILNESSLVNWMSTHEYPSGNECINNCNNYSQKIVDMGGNKEYTAQDYINIIPITLTENIQNLVHIKYFDKYYFDVAYVGAIKNKCFNIDCGYLVDDDCSSFEHDMVVLCGG